MIASQVETSYRERGAISFLERMGHRKRIVIFRQACKLNAGAGGGRLESVDACESEARAGVDDYV